MADEAGNNVINNYKGVMLCSRPNQKKASNFEKPFCARVVPGELLGINPVKPEHQERPNLSRQPAVLSKHKKWLTQFKEHVHKTKVSIEEKGRLEEEKFQRIKEQAEADRQRARKMKEEYQQAATQVLNVLDQKTSSGPSAQLNLTNLRKLDAQNQSSKKEKKGDQFKKKGEKPLWAMTKDKAEATQDKEVDELLDFFEQNQVTNFSQDEEIKDLLIHLKQRVEKMKEEDNWKEREAERIKRAKETKQADNDDKYSQFSAGVSEGRSVASQKTQKKLEDLRAKMKEPKEWDAHTVSEKSSTANIEDRIAKNLADEVLRNYPNMRGVHSNAEAARVMNEPIVRPVITTIVRQKQPINANTLPYLHRNPAI